MNGKWTKENFEKHHAENPEIYRKFCHYAFKAAAVREHYSAKCIFHRVRWETQIEERKTDFKIDDGWIAHYARMFMDDYPDHKDFFETRVRRNSYHHGQVNIGETGRLL
jgi:hypothetical protein